MVPLSGFTAIDIAAGDFSGRSSLRTTNGNDHIGIDDSVFGGAFSANTLGGNDDLRIETSIAGGASTFAGRVNINMGSGNDTLILGILAQPGNSASFRQPVRLNGGPGIDLVDYQFNGNTYDFAPIVVGFETEI